MPRLKPSPEIRESSLNIIAEGTRLEGKIFLEHVSRVHGVLNGEVHGNDGSTVILAESALVEGEIHADTLIVNGFVQGTIHARTRVVISGTGRVIGDIDTPSLQVEFGGYFDGKCRMEKPAEIKSGL